MKWLLLITLLLAGCAAHVPIELPTDQAGGSAQQVTASWTPPCVGPEDPCGGPWTMFVLELRRGRGDWQFAVATPETTAVLTLAPGTWRARVAARNAEDEQGPWSAASDPFTVAGPKEEDRLFPHEQQEGRR